MASTIVDATGDGLRLVRAGAVPLDALRAAADVLNAGERVAIMIGQGARDAADRAA